MCRCLDGQRGIFTAEDVEAALRPPDPHFPRTRLVCVENTHNRGGGKVWSLPQVQAVAAAARRNQLLLHLDGARLWNAAVASGVAERDYATFFDTVSVCFSKGLGAPVGSILAGSRPVIDRARRFRKLLGGGMRQVGIIAAGALFALRHHRARLTEDHANAQHLAAGLARFPGIELDPADVETNMVRFRLRTEPAAQVVERLCQRGVLVLPVGRDTIRAVTNLMVSRDDMDIAIREVASVLR
jgi:threonine aldolase